MSPLRILFALLAVTAVGCASEEDADVGQDALDPADEASALINGEVASPAQFPATVFLIEKKCTAAKVAPKVLLTAAHCVWDAMAKEPSLAPGRPLSYAKDPKLPGKPLTVTSVVIHPAWQAACTKDACISNEVTAKLDAPDVAVIKVETDLDDVRVAQIEDKPLERGDRVIVLGYGCEAGVMGERPKLDERKLKFSETSIIPATRTAHEGSPVTREDVPKVAGSYAITGGPGLVNARAGLCPGDSGGPVYRWRGSKLVVVGVNSNYTFKADDTVGLPVTNFHTRLDGRSQHQVAKFLREQGAISDAAN